MRNKITSNMESISVRTFLKAVEGKEFRIQLHYYKDANSNKNFSVADVIASRIERDCDGLIFYFGKSWLLVRIKNDDVQRFYHGDDIHYCIEADGVDVFVNIR